MIESNRDKRVAERVMMIGGAQALAESARLIRAGKREKAHRLLIEKRKELNRENDSYAKSPAVDRQLLYIDKNLTDDSSVTFRFQNNPEMQSKASRIQALSRQAYEHKYCD